MSEEAVFWLTLAWFTLTYAGLALGKLPRLRTDRAGIALVGAALMLVTPGVLGFKQAVAAVDFATLALLLGMMVVVAFLRLAGFFDRLAGWALARVNTPRGLLAVTMTLAGVLSAFLVNDVVCLALTPLVLHLAEKLRFDPKPHLLGVALASNIGSTATLTGNPQNMIIGNLSGISYVRFAERLTPIAVLGLLVGFAVVAWCYRRSLSVVRCPSPAPQAKDGGRRTGNGPKKRLLVKSLAVTAAAVAAFFAGAPMEVTALAAAAVLLLDRVNPHKIYRQLDWSLLVMFAGLFVVVHAFNVHVVRTWHVERWQFLQESPVMLLSVVSAVLSNVVSNVPAVLLFQPVLSVMPADVRETAWLALAMSSTLAGNLTVLGSVANLIVVEHARREGVAITFAEYLRVGVPVTLLTLALGIGWLAFVQY